MFEGTENEILKMITKENDESDEQQENKHHHRHHSLAHQEDNDQEADAFNFEEDGKD